MEPKRYAKKVITKRNTSEIVESSPVTMPFLLDTQLFIEKHSDITWNIVKEAFMTTNYK